METSIEHLARRVSEERARSERAVTPAEYRTHLLLAHEYERRLIASDRRARSVKKAEPALPPARIKIGESDFKSGEIT